MIGMLICAAVVAAYGSMFTGAPSFAVTKVDRLGGLALIAAALYLAWRAGGVGA